MRCLCRGNHETGGGDRRRVILLGDQAVPALWEAAGGAACILILRIEYGYLKELAEELVERMRGQFLAGGSVVLLFSATNLAAVGTAAYCQDLVRAVSILRRGLGEQVLFTPLPHIFMGGCNDGPTIRSAVDVSMWATRYFGGERLVLKKTFGVANDILAETGGSGYEPATSSRYWLPHNGGNGETERIWISDGKVPLPLKVAPVTISLEKKFYEALVGELRSGMAIDIDPEACMDRTIPAPAASGGGAPGGGESGTSVSVLVVGGSNAKRLCEAMKAAGIAAGLLHLPNLRLIRGAGDLVAGKLRDEVDRKKPEAIVLQFMDNSSFEALTVEGSRIPPRKCEGKHHLDGDIAVVEKASTVAMLRGCRPVLNATAGIKTVFIGPMPRYVVASCCADPEHMANRVAPGFFTNMKRDLAALN
jgi:hypothetical protein